MGILISFLTFALTTFGPGAALYLTYTTIQLLWPHLRPFARLGPIDAPLQRFLHATKGKPAWALVLGAADPIGAALCAELASRGFNVVLYGRGVSAVAHLTKLRETLKERYHENKYRIVVADADADAPAAREFAGRVAASLRDVNLTVVVGNTGVGVGADVKVDQSAAKAVRYLTAAVLPLLKRSAPALLVNVVPAVPGDTGERACLTCNVPTALPCTGVDIVTCRLGEFAAAGARVSPSLLRPAPGDLARALLLHAGCGGSSGGKGGVVNPYWPHALVQMMQTVLPPWVVLGLAFSDRELLVRIGVRGM